MTTYTVNSRTIREFEKLVFKEIEAVKEVLVAGTLTDMSQYRQLTGKIVGLNAALELLGDAQKIAEEGM